MVGISHQVNVGGTRNVLDAMAETGTGRIVFASSQSTAARAAEDAEHRTSQTRVEADAGGLRDRLGRDPFRARPRPKRRQLGAPLLALPVFPDGRAGRPCRSFTSTTRCGCQSARSGTPKRTAARSISPPRAS